MEKQIRKTLCGDCLKRVRYLEAKFQKSRRKLKVKVVGNQDKEQVIIKK